MSTLLGEITSNDNEDFYCLNCFHSYSIEKKLKKHERVCNDHDYYVELPNEYSTILKYSHGEKSLKAPFMIYAHLECLLQKMHSCQSNPENLIQRQKLNIHVLVTHCLQILCLI